MSWPTAHPQGGGQLVGVVLLPWMGHVRVYVAVPSSRMDLLALPVDRPDVYQVTERQGVYA